MFKKIKLLMLFVLATAICVIGMTSCDISGQIADISGAVACTHDFEGTAVNVEATCDSMGYSTETCTKCGFTKFAVTPALGHSYDEGRVVLEATPHEKGIKLFTCSTCEGTKTELLDALGKVFSSGLAFERTSLDEYTVVGKGTCTDKDIVIPDTYEGRPVTKIAPRAFFEDTDITSIDIPESIIEVGERAFSECPELAEVLIAGAAEVGERAFASCPELEEVIISGAAALGEKSFSGCAKLEDVYMGHDVEIGLDVFRDSIYVEITVEHEVTFIEAKEATCTEPGNIAYYWCETCDMAYEDQEQTVRLYDVIIPSAHSFVDGVCEKCTQAEDSVLIVEIDPVADLGKFALGTLEDAIGLPAAVKVRTADGVSHDIPVVWNLSDYDKSTAGEYTIHGVLQSGEFHYADGLSKNISTGIEIVEFMRGTADVVFILDISGSMGDEINNVKENIQAFAQAIEDQGVSARWAAITYSDYLEYPSDEREQTQIIMNGASSWYTGAADYKAAIGNIVLANGGDWEETAVDGLLLAKNQLTTRQDARVFYILLTDAECKLTNTHDDTVTSLEDVANTLDAESINTSIITSTGLYDHYGALSATTGGINADIYDNFANALLEELVPIIYGEVIE